MRKSSAVLSILAVLACVELSGCGGKSRPDPSTRPGFVDTSDPTKLVMPPLPAPGGQPSGQPPGAPPAGP